ncbi:hypothetical protein SEA_YAKULT_12 [Gordonia phage Yakult]|nr:hypothetical protein SEA_YAKULT_12 [Gordonia phage Yakult]
MGNLKINKQGFRAIRSAPGVKAKNDELAQTIAARCNNSTGGDDYRTSSQEGAARPQGRHRATVITATAAAQRDNAAHNTLLREFFGVRG